MFYENNNNWSTGEHNVFETFVMGIIFVLFASIIIMIFYTPSNTTTSHKKESNAQIENKNIQDIKETDNSKRVNTYTNFNLDNNTINIKEQERQVKKEQKMQEEVERQQQKQEIKRKKQQEKLEQKAEKQRLKKEKYQQKLEQKAEKQRLKEEKHQQKLERKNKKNTEKELPNINDSVEDIS